MIGQGLSGAYTWLVYPGLTCSVQQPGLKRTAATNMLGSVLPLFS